MKKIHKNKQIERTITQTKWKATMQFALLKKDLFLTYDFYKLQQ